MSIMSGQKTWLLLGVLAIAGGAAFVYFDPLGLDPLGLKSGDSAAKSAAAPNEHTTPAAARAAVVPAKASISAASAVLPATGAAVTPAAPSSAVAAISPAHAEVPPPVAPVHSLQHPSEFSKTASSADKTSEPGKTAGRPMKPTEPMKPMDSDLRYCLKLDTDAAIAKCAGE